MKKIFLLAIIMVLFVSITYAQSTWLSFDGGQTSEGTKPIMEFTDNGISGVEIDYYFLGATVTDKIVQDTTYKYLHIDQFGLLGEVGKPALPVRNYTIVVPIGASISIDIIETESMSYSNYLIHPALEPAIDVIGAPEPEFVIDRDFYNSDVEYPENIVEVGEIGYIRSTPITRIIICPVKYNPAQRKITVYSRIKFNVEFTGGSEFVDSQYYSENFARMLRNIAINGENVVKPTGAKNDTICILIITHPDYYEAADTLTTWKEMMGFDVALRTTDETGNTSDEIKDYIHNAYNTWSTPPDYFILIGDQEDVPGEFFIDTDPIPWIPIEYQNFYSDVSYACMGGTYDYFPDIGHGRISVSTPNEAMMVIQKIVNYQKNPVTDTYFYHRGICAAYFQDTGGDGYADRRFAQTSWEIRQHLENNYPYLIDREFYAENPENVLYWNNGYYSNGEPVPDYLLYPNYAWDGNGLHIKNEINEGRFLVTHRDHGGPYSWGEPHFTTSDIDELVNGDKLPVVFSINCLTGKFDIDCFCEAFLRHPNGGAVGSFGASRISFSGNNDGLSEGFIDAIWPGLVPLFPHNPDPYVTEHEPIYEMGLVLNQGKFRMTETWGTSYAPWNKERLTFRMFHYFGDPTMQIWTGYPTQILANYNSILFIGQSSFSISGANCITGSATIRFNNEIIGKGKLVDGSVEIDIINPPDTTGIAKLTIVSHNYYPLQVALGIIPPTTVVINPDSIPINQQTEVTISVFQDLKQTPLPDVNIKAYGPGVFGDTLGITDENGICVLNFGAEHGGGELVRIKGWESGAGYYLFNEAITVMGGLNLTNPDLSVTTDIGIIDTFAMNLPGILHSYVEENGYILWARVNNNDWQSTTEDSMEIIPEEVGTVTGMIAKTDYNIYTEEFPIIRVYGIVSGVVTDTNGIGVANTKVKIYPEDNPVFPVVVAITDSSGNYESSIEIPADYYVFRVVKWGYEPYEQTHLVGDGINIINIEIEPSETYMVEGWIFFENGDPGIATVKVYRNDNYDLVDSLECNSYGTFALFTVELISYIYLFVIEATGYEVLDTVIVVVDDMIIGFEPEPHDYVKEVPSEYPSIQDAINNSFCVDGDTILVSPGTYYENINFIGKNITVGSLFLTSKDTSYISQTIINGNGGGSVVTFENVEDTTAILTGFTIIQGSGRLIEIDGERATYGGGIYSEDSSPTLIHLIIKENNADLGAGICVDYGSYVPPAIIIKYCLIAENNSTTGGGGVFVRGRNAELINCSIVNNSSEIMAGAIFGHTLNTNIVNCILWGNSQLQGTFCLFAGLIDTVTISYSDVEDGQDGITITNPNGLIWDEDTNIDTNPFFVNPSSGDYSLTWNNSVRSLCIDTGDPDEQYNDPDGTPSDMGAIPAINHNYDCRTLKEGWNWFSFPVLDTLSSQADTALTVLAPILDNLEVVLFESRYPVIWWNPEIWDWENEIGDFHSVDGYKIQMNAQDTLPISGFLEEPDEVITLEAEAEYGNWIGYFLGYSQMPHNAFAEVWDTLTYIKAEDWAMYKKQGQWWGAYGTVDYGKSYVIGCSDDCSFTWGYGLQADHYTKSETSVFSYQEKSDYMAVFVDSTEAVTSIDEIGVFLGNECIGASKVEEFPVFIPSYKEDEDSTGSKDYGELTFQIASYGKSGKRGITAFVYNEMKDAFVKEPIILDNKSYAIVRLGTGAGIEFPKEFTLYQNFPNPITSSTTISFIPAPGIEKSEIKIYNIRGQLVTQLNVQNEKGKMNRVEWSGKDYNGRQVGNGIYFYKVISGKKSDIRKMVLLR